MAERRGSVNCVVRLLWSTKYTLPVAVFRISQPGGKGPSSSQLILLRSLKCKFESKLDININKCSTGFVQMYRYLLLPVLQCTHSYMHQVLQVIKIAGKGLFDRCLSVLSSGDHQHLRLVVFVKPFLNHFGFASRCIIQPKETCSELDFGVSSKFILSPLCLSSTDREMSSSTLGGNNTLSLMTMVILSGVCQRWLSWMFFFQGLMPVQGLWCIRTSALTPVKVSFAWSVM